MNSNRSLIIPALALGLVGCALLTPDPLYLHESPHIYDAARLVGSEEFSEKRVLETFRTFSDVNCRQGILARLTVSTNRRDLGAAFGTSFHETDPAKIIRAGFLTLELRNPEIAQAWCFDGEAIALIRRTDQIKQYQLKGRSDARKITLGENIVTMIGFELYSGARDRISLYAQVSALPPLNLAEALRDELEKRTSTAAFLILRTEPFFVEDGGPTWDLFARNLPEGSAVPFLDRPRIECPPKFTGGRCILVTKPPVEPAEAWGR